MLGLIVTGHGQFAAGLHHATGMIAGDLPHVKKVLFPDGAPLEEFSQALAEAIQEAHAQYKGALVLTDLKGGTPFNHAMMIASKLDNVAVLSGTNLPMMIEGSMLSQFSESAEQLAQQLVEVGRNGVDFPTITVAAPQADDFDEEDGI